MAHHLAGCSCGAIRLKATGAPLRVGICHCLDCRKHHGALFYAAAIFDENAVEISGTSAEYKGRHVCPACGASVFARTGREIEIHLGSFDTPDAFVPTYECWTIRRERILAPLPGAAQFEHDRTDVTQTES